MDHSLCKTVLRSAARVFGMWVAILFFSELFVFAEIPLGARFDLSVFVFAPLVALAGAVCLEFLSPKIQVRCAAMEKRIIVFRVMVAVGVLSLVVAAVPPIVERSSRSSDAEASYGSFVPFYSSDVEPSRVERTLAEFERARRSLAEHWRVPESSPRVSIYLFRDRAEYAATSALDWSTGYARCLVNEVIVGVPLEEATNFLEEMPPTRTPVHEMVHAMWCQILGRSGFESIPRWFHEGMAQRYETRGIRQFFERAVRRWLVWSGRAEMLPQQRFCEFNPGDDIAEIGSFYLIAAELIASLEARYGIHSLNAIVDDVGKGSSFNQSLRGRASGTCASLYSEWVENV